MVIKEFLIYLILGPLHIHCLQKTKQPLFLTTTTALKPLFSDWLPLTNRRFERYVGVASSYAEPREEKQRPETKALSLG